ncbi:MAG: DUF4175 family protein [Kofleriaceae bacterium]|nr:DUF4175 family protein [Kofleriaceae bacterium]
MANSATKVSGFLSIVRDSLLRHEAHRAVGWTTSAIATIGLATALAGFWLVGSRATALSIISIGGVAALLTLIAGAVFGWVVPRKRFATDQDVARFVGSAQPQVASDLLSAVQFSQAGNAANAAGSQGTTSRDMIEALINATANRIETIAPATLIAHRDRIVAARIGMASVVTVGLLTIAAPQVRHGWRNLVAPRSDAFHGAALSSVPIVGDLDIKLTYPAYTHRAEVTLTSASGDIRAPAGTRVTLLARPLLNVSVAELMLEGATPNDTQTIALVTADDRLVGEFIVKKSGRYRFAVVDDHRRRTIEASPRTIELEVDRAPTAQLIAPADVLDVSNLRQVELAYVLEDDYGITSIELMWISGRESGKKVVPMGPAIPTPNVANSALSPTPATKSESRITGKLLWDMAELPLPAGAEVRYWLEVKDNDNINGPNLGRSKEYRLKVISPRERHEQVLAKQQELADKMLDALAERLVIATGPGGPTASATPARGQLSLGERETMQRYDSELVASVVDIRAAFDKDVHASDALRKMLDKMRDRLDKLVTADNHVMDALQRELQSRGKAPVLLGRFTSSDTKWILELEDDALQLADWLDRERVEAMLDVADEAAAHRKRLKELLDEYAKTGDPRLKAEIERAMRALQQSLAQLEKHRAAVPQDVLDQFVNRDALTQQQAESCLDEVQRLFATGKIAEAQAKLATCSQTMDAAAEALENSLQQLRGDRFSDEQHKLDEVMNELADTAKDQDDIAGEASRMFDEYAAKADTMSSVNKREAASKVALILDKVRRHLRAIPDNGLTPFSKEELDIVERRIADVERTVDDGDLAEAAAMAKQAQSSLQTIAGELDAAMTDDPQSPFADATADALAGTEKAGASVKELVDALNKLAPSPQSIMSADDKRAMERLRRRQALNRDRATKLAERAKQLGSELPGGASGDIAKRLGNAVERMGAADDRLKATDPGGARAATRAASEALDQARKKARDAARQRQEGAGASEEPIRIPGADDYKAPEQFREDILEAMKKRGPGGYDDMLKRYYEELIR